MGDLRDRVLSYAGARPATPGEMRTYEVRSIEGDATAPPVVLTITVPAACPVVVRHEPTEYGGYGASGLEVVKQGGPVRCGLARSEPEPRKLRDSWTGAEYVITAPERHPCGHAVLHRDLIAEAARFAMAPKPLAEAS